MCVRNSQVDCKSAGFAATMVMETPSRLAEKKVVQHRSALNASVGIVLSPTGSHLRPQSCDFNVKVFPKMGYLQIFQMQTVWYWKPWFWGTPILGNFHVYFLFIARIPQR